MAVPLKTNEEPTIEDLIAKFEQLGYEVDIDSEGGQPNGVGEIEPSWYREWFHQDQIRMSGELLLSWDLGRKSDDY